MAAPSVTWTFANSTTSDATQVNTNFTDIINALTDGTKDIAIGTLSVSGNSSFSGNVTLGNASADDITISGSIAATIPVKTNATYNFGSATSALLSIYLGNGTKSTRILAGTVGTSWTFTLPNDVPTITGQTMVFNTSGTAEFRYPDKFTASKTGDYTATGDETVIPCAPSASMTISLPAASTMTGKSLTIIKTDSDITKTVTIDGNSSETINGATTYVLYTQYESVTIKCNGTAWYVTDHFAETPETDAGAITVTATTSNPTKGTVTTDKFYWKRRGKFAVCRYQYNQSALGSGAAGTGDYLFALPSGLTIDTTNITLSTTVIGSGGTGAYLNNFGSCISHGIAGGNNRQFTGGVVVYDSTNVRFIGTSHDSGSGTAASAAISASINGFGQTSCQINAFFEVPISGWNP